VLENGNIYKDSEFLRELLKYKIGMDLAEDLKGMPERVISEMENKKQEEKDNEDSIIIHSKLDTKPGKPGTKVDISKPRANEIMPFEERDEVFRKYNPEKVIDIIDTNKENSAGDGKCYVYNNPSITNNGKKDLEKMQEQRGNLYIFEPSNGCSTTKIFFIPEELLTTENDINKLIKEYLEMPISDFQKSKGTSIMSHTKMESFEDSVRFFITGKRGKSLSYFARNSERIKNLYKSETLDVGYRPRSAIDISKIADGERPDDTLIKHVQNLKNPNIKQ